jgi:diguanylate cyclase (GGDEF)-like protein
MKSERVLAWLPEEATPFDSPFPSGALPFRVEETRVPTAELVAERLACDPFDVLCIADAPPFARTRRFLAATDDMPGRPVVIAVARGIDVPTAVELMERGAFTVAAGEPCPERLSESIGRAVENRRAFERIVRMSRSLERSKTSLVRTSRELSAEKVKLRRKVTEVTLMRRVAEWLGRSRTLEEGLTVVLHKLVDFAGAESGAFLVSPEKDRWMECGAGACARDRLVLPRKENTFLRPTSFLFSADAFPGFFLPSANGVPPGAVAFPVRVKRKFLGYGILWGPALPPPAADALRLLEAVGVQLGVFCRKVVLQGQVETERDRLARANDELNFLFGLATSLHKGPDPDAVFEWLSREIHRFVPVAGIELVSLIGAPTVRTSGACALPGAGNAGTAAHVAAWTDHLMSRHRIRVGEGGLAVRTFPFRPGPDGSSAPVAAAGGRTFETTLEFGGEKLGILTVRFSEEAASDVRGRNRILSAVGSQLSLFLRNVAEMEKVRDMAVQDCLTGLNNYRSFQETFTREFERVQRYERNLSLLMIDLDNFKTINDTFGHQVGDQVLRRVGDLIRKNLRGTDYAFRYGGDEFVVLMPDRGAVHAIVFAQRLRASIKQEIRGVPPYEFSLSMSIGIADCGLLSSYQKEELLLRADGALYRAKAHGRDRIQVAEAASPGNPDERELHAV